VLAQHEKVRASGKMFAQTKNGLGFPENVCANQKGLRLLENACANHKRF
jgi:hypothetical protein